MTRGIPTPFAALRSPPPDILRCAYVELVVSDLARARAFWVDLLGLVVTEEDASSICLRTFDEFIHHNLVLREGPHPGCATVAYRVRSPQDVDRAAAWYAEAGCEVRRGSGFTRGIGDAVRVCDPLGFTVEYFYEAEHAERLSWRFDLQRSGALQRIDHVNLCTPDVARSVELLEALGFLITEDIRDDAGTIYAAWARRKPTVHDVAMTGEAGPRLHHVAFAARGMLDILAVCDHIGSLGHPEIIERGPGRHGVSNACYVYLRDPDGHRVELYTQDYYTGDPDNPRVSWDVRDPQRRDWWGNPVITSWYTEASAALDLDGLPVPLTARAEPEEQDVEVGADGFTRPKPRPTPTGPPVLPGRAPNP